MNTTPKADLRTAFANKSHSLADKLAFKVLRRITPQEVSAKGYSPIGNQVKFREKILHLKDPPQPVSFIPNQKSGTPISGVSGKAPTP